MRKSKHAHTLLLKKRGRAASAAALTGRSTTARDVPPDKLHTEDTPGLNRRHQMKNQGGRVVNELSELKGRRVGLLNRSTQRNFLQHVMPCIPRHSLCVQSRGWGTAVTASTVHPSQLSQRKRERDVTYMSAHMHHTRSYHSCCASSNNTGTTIRSSRSADAHHGRRRCSRIGLQHS
jgi:hypothetical protein